SWNVGKTAPDERCIPIAQPFEPFVNLASAPTGINDRPNIYFGRRLDSHSGSVIKEHIQFLDVVDCLATHERMNATGVVADHATECASAVRGRIRCESQLKLLCLCP